jgi:hypothetical protein
MKATKLMTVIALLAFAHIGRADPLDQWTWRSPWAPSARLYAVTYGNGQFVAVGDKGAILSSPDGTAWILRQAPTNLVGWQGAGLGLTSIAYGNGGFVAVGGISLFGSISMSSADGANWVMGGAPLPENVGGASGGGIAFGHGRFAWAGTAVSYGNGQFVAVGDGGWIATSADGTNWFNQQSGTTSWLRSITYGNGQYVVAGVQYRPSLFSSILTSADGTNWVERESGLSNLILEGVTYGDGQFVAVGGDFNGNAPMILTSVDGVSWTPRQSPAGIYLYGVTYGNSRFVAVGDSGAILTSASIIQVALKPKPGKDLFSLWLTGPAGLAYTVQSSSDLISWQTVTNLTSIQPTTFISDVLPGTAARVFYRAYSQ